MVVLLAACPSSQTTASIPDPRLGVVVFETTDRAFSRADGTYLARVAIPVKHNCPVGTGRLI